MNNFVIHIFDDLKEGEDVNLDYNNTDIITNPNPKTLGIKINMPSEGRTNQVFSGRDPIYTLYSFFISLINTMFTQIERSHIKKDYWERTITIQVPETDITNFTISPEEKINLVEFGRRDACKYFNLIRSLQTGNLFKEEKEEKEQNEKELKEQNEQKEEKEDEKQKEDEKKEKIKVI